MSFLNENDWIEIKQNNIWLNTFESSCDRRLVFFRGNNVEIKSIGSHTVSAFSVQAIGMVAMIPSSIGITWSQGLFSLEGVPMKCAARIVLKVIDAEAAIRRIALHGEAQKSMVWDVILKRFQKICTENTYRTFYDKLGSISTLLSSQAKEDVASRDLPFELIDIVLYQCEPLDQQLAEMALRDEQVRLNLKKEQARVEGELKSLEIEEQMQDKRHAAKLRRENAEAAAVRSRQLEDLKLRAEFLSQPGGLMLMYPEQGIELEMKKLELELAQARERNKLIEKMAMNAGTLSWALVEDVLKKHDYHATIKVLESQAKPPAQLTSQEKENPGEEGADAASDFGSGSES